VLNGLSFAGVFVYAKLKYSKLIIIPNFIARVPLNHNVLTNIFAPQMLICSGGKD
jgi:hypothetical protein